MADSCQCMTKPITIKKIKKKRRYTQAVAGTHYKINEMSLEY